MFALLMGLKNISATQLQKAIGEQSVMVIDVNSRQSWMKAHVPGAVNLDPANFSENDLPKDKQLGLVFYCSNPMCRKAPLAARQAKKWGYGNVEVLSAGISGWIAAKLPVEAGV